MTHVMDELVNLIKSPIDRYRGTSGQGRRDEGRPYASCIDGLPYASCVVIGIQVSNAPAGEGTRARVARRRQD